MNYDPSGYLPAGRRSWSYNRFAGRAMAGLVSYGLAGRGIRYLWRRGVSSHNAVTPNMPVVYLPPAKRPRTIGPARFYGSYNGPRPVYGPNRMYYPVRPRYFGKRYYRRPFYRRFYRRY